MWVLHFVLFESHNHIQSQLTDDLAVSTSQGLGMHTRSIFYKGQSEVGSPGPNQFPLVSWPWFPGSWPLVQNLLISMEEEVKNTHWPVWLRRS